MDIDFAFICDYAEIGNKINALGIGFDTIHVQQIPHFYLVAQIRASVAEVGDKQIEIRLIDADGVDVISPVTGSFNIPRSPPGTTESLAA